MAANIVLESSQVFYPSRSRSSREPLGDQGHAIVVPTIENVVSTVNLCCTLDLKVIAFHARNVRVQPRKVCCGGYEDKGNQNHSTYFLLRKYGLHWSQDRAAIPLGCTNFAMYEPELFPGLIYRMKQSKIMVQVYSSGKIAIAGAQNTDDIFKAFKKIYPIPLSFKLTSRRVLEDLTDSSSGEEEEEEEEEETVLHKLLYSFHYLQG
ncbi:hypothetical protein DITRI_Ditri06bG0117700 [Diplodiscus trichospermus]